MEETHQSTALTDLHARPPQILCMRQRPAERPSRRNVHAHRGLSGAFFRVECHQEEADGFRKFAFPEFRFPESSLARGLLSHCTVHMLQGQRHRTGHAPSSALRAAGQICKKSSWRRASS